MKKNYLYFLPLFSLLFFSSCKKNTENIDSEIIAKNQLIDSTLLSFEKNLIAIEMDSVFAKNHFNGLISVEQNGEKIYEKEGGFLDFKNKIKLDGNSVFAVGSVSKQFTSVMILSLQEEGGLDIKTPVSKYLTEFKTPQKKHIKIEELLNHTSGISDFGSGMLSKPGAEFHYSNKGYRFLGDILEKISGKSYTENALELFKKVGLQNTSTAKLETDANFASAHLGDAQVNSEVKNMPERLMKEDISIAAGGILSNANDLHKWNDALYNGKILKTTLSEFLKKSSSTNHHILGKVDYGLGIMMNKKDQQSFFHTGYVKGSPSLVMYYPETKTSVVVLSNIAEETRGKMSIFRPHLEVKEKMDFILAAFLKTKNNSRKDLSLSH